VLCKKLQCDAKLQHKREYGEFAEILSDAKTLLNTKAAGV
jgi:hypothetical protein